MRRLRIVALAAVCSLAACAQMMGARSGVLPSPPSPPAPIATVATAAGADGLGGSHLNGIIVRSQLEALIGKTPGEARSMLLGYGHVGEVKVAPGQKHYDGCKMERICSMDVAESGMGVHDPITLYVNPGLKIAPPPP